MVKKYLLFTILSLSNLFATAQILCVQCYDQNARISTGVNNLILNGGFESNTCVPNMGSFCPNSVYYSCNITNWVCSGGGQPTYARITDSTYTNIIEGGVAAYFGNNYAKVCSPTANDTSCLINNSCVVTGIPSGYPNNTSFGGITGIALLQATNLTPNNKYVLEFWAGGEAWGTESGLFAVDVGFGQTFLRCKPTYNASIDSIGTRFIIQFTATSTLHYMKFTNWGHICQACTELVLDDVRLYTLAELSNLVPHCVIGIDDLNENSSPSIYPTPFTNTLNIETHSNHPSTVVLYDIASRKVLQQDFTGSVNLNTSALARGIYMYEVRGNHEVSGGVVKKGKVVKE